MLSFLLIIWLGAALFRNNISRDVLDSFSTKSTHPVRGILAIMIVLHHFSTLFADEFPWLEQASFWGVPVCTLFFFFSGYGLTASYLCKGKEYLENFLSKRMKKLVVPIFIVVAIHMVLLALTGQFEINSLLSGLLHGSPVLPHLWFVCALIVFYLIFYVSMRFVPPFWRGISLIFFCTIIYVVIIKLLDWETYWSLSIHGFVYGMLVATQDKKVSLLFDKYPILLLVCFTVFTLFVNAYCLLGNTGILRLLAWGTLYYWMLPIVVYGLTRLHPIPSSKLLTHLGKISLEIYLVHVSVMLFMHPLISGALLFFIVTISFTFVCAHVLRILGRTVSYNS